MTFHAPVPQWPGGAAAAVTLSFDDARDSQLDTAIPILDAHGLRATFYVMPAPLRRRAPEWAAAARDGHELGNHSTTHPCSGNYRWEHDPAEDRTLADMERELDLCDAAIEEVCGHRPTTFAYPCSRTHVGRGMSNVSYVPLIARRYVIGRLYGDLTHAVPSFVDLALVPAIDSDNRSLAALLERVETAIEGGGWLNLAAHDVDGPPPGPDQEPDQSVDRDVFEALCARLAVDERVWVATTAAVGELIAEARAAA